MENTEAVYYPRPDLERKEWISLDGIWEFGASDEGREIYDRKILVPYPPESRKSGIERITMPEDTLYYRRKVKIAKEEGKRYILSFLAVDYEAEVFIDGNAVIRHKGGYLPFSADITDYIKTDEIEIKLRVKDPTDKGDQARGKQSLRPHQIWYGPVSGIWQSVWIDIVPEHHITGVMTTPLEDLETIDFLVAANDTGNALLTIDGKEFGVPLNKHFVVKLEDPKLWSPESPYLYYYSVKAGEDEAKGYTALRTFGQARDEDGIERLMLNGRPYFHHGVLDQGYWEDGLLTTPSDEEIMKDLLMLKKMGFNTIRKHVKIESPRWYHLASKVGFLVWQDAVNGGGKYSFLATTAPLFLGSFIDDRKHHRMLARENEEENGAWQSETESMVMHLYSQPCIAMWVIFNEAWGQFDSKDMYEKVLSLDRTRTIDVNSGWHDQHIGPFVSHHVYFRPYRFRPDKYGRCTLLSEFGGYGLDLSEKEKKRMFSYKKIKDSRELTREIVALYERDVIPYIKDGLSAAIYTQLSDVEAEKNGLVTYDRKTLKVDAGPLLAMSGKLKI